MESTQELVRKYLTLNEIPKPHFESDNDDDESEGSLFAVHRNEYKETSHNTSTASFSFESGGHKALNTAFLPDPVLSFERNLDGEFSNFSEPNHSNFLCKAGLEHSAVVTEEFAKYLKLLGSSVQELMLQLEEERRQNFELRKRINGMEFESQELQKLRNDHELLRSSYDSLAVKNKEFELNLKRLNPDYEKVSLETRLLREKLVKYKRLYEEKLVKDENLCAGEHLSVSHHSRDADKIKSNNVLAVEEPKGPYFFLDKILHILSHELADSRGLRSHFSQSDNKAAKALTMFSESPHRERIRLSHIQRLINVLNSMRTALDDTIQVCSHETSRDASFLDNNCGPCSNATSALSSRPNSQSTPTLKINASHELMGKHHWKTI